MHRYRQGIVPSVATRAEDPPQAHEPRSGDRPREAEPDRLRLAGRRLAAACDQAPERVAAALAAFDFRAATAAIWELVEEANRHVELTEPWRLARAEKNGDAGAEGLLDASLALLWRICAQLGRELAPFLPDLAARVRAACDPTAGRLPPLEPVFPRIR